MTIPFLLGCSPSAGKANQLPEDHTKTPVLFVHGSGLDGKTWGPMIDYLLQQGYPPSFLVAVDLKPNSGSNVRAAETIIAQTIEELLMDSRAEAEKAGQPRPSMKVDVVAHSMGAVSSRWYAAKIEPGCVRTLITIAGANHGTDALRGISGAGNREMVPPFASSAEESAVQAALNGIPDDPTDETPYGLGLDREGVPSLPPSEGREVLYLTIRLPRDRWITPESSAMLDGAGGIELAVPTDVPVSETSPGNFLFHGRSGHDGLPRNPDVIRLVASFLLSRDRPESEER